jgi:Protein of unknown function (DUF2798)
MYHMFLRGNDILKLTSRYLFGIIIITSMTLLTSFFITTLNVGLKWQLFEVWLRSFSFAISFSLPIGLAMSILTRKMLS